MENKRFCPDNSEIITYTYNEPEGDAGFDDDGAIEGQIEFIFMDEPKKLDEQEVERLKRLRRDDIINAKNFLKLYDYKKVYNVYEGMFGVKYEETDEARDKEAKRVYGKNHSELNTDEIISLNSVFYEYFNEMVKKSQQDNDKFLKLLIKNGLPKNL